jgi:hypothetical protein
MLTVNPMPMAELGGRGGGNARAGAEMAGNCEFRRPLDATIGGGDPLLTAVC